MASEADNVDVNLSKHEERKRSLKKFTYRGVEMQNLLDMKQHELFALFSSRLRRKFRNGIYKRQQTFLKKLRKAVCDFYFSFDLYSSTNPLFFFFLTEKSLPNR